MHRLTKSLKNFFQREDGPTAVEYAVMLALIIIVCIISIQAVGNNSSTKYRSVATSLGS
jgi:pilus assembly protein Flp/PilA